MILAPNRHAVDLDYHETTDTQADRFAPGRHECLDLEPAVILAVLALDPEGEESTSTSPKI